MSSSRFLYNIIGIITVLQLSYATDTETAIQPDCKLKKCSNSSGPVCAYDGTCYKTFTDACELDVANCDREHEKKFKEEKSGECSADDVPSCDTITSFDTCPDTCTTPNDPLCGYNGFEFKTFENQCYMDMENCQDPNDADYRMAYAGACGDYTTV